MSCQRWQDAILSFFDGQLSEQAEGKLRQHLHDCEACHEQFQLQERIEGYFIGRTHFEPAADFTSRALTQAKALAAKERRQFQWPIWMDYAVGTALALVLLAVLWPTLSTLSTMAGDRAIEFGNEIQAVSTPFLLTLLTPYSEQIPLTPLSMVCMGAVLFFAGWQTYRALAR